MIKLADHTYYVSANILVMLKDEMKDDDKRVDFEGTEIIPGSHKGIATFILDTGIIPINISSKDDIDKIETEKLKLKQKNFDTIDEFIEDFHKEFPVGTICILDQTMAKRKKLSEVPRYVIMIDRYVRNDVVVRKYKPSVMLPHVFNSYPDKHDAKELYHLEHFSFSDLFTRTSFIRHANPPGETVIIEQLFGRSR